ncbi:uncharacterized protein DUF2786 [Breoghania corrubedonensis]|uniref:Uncharacterized protein DUF2786 n=1 Tax=Breoghania corrubedonensis TaxID=665038 RepID=A0A2T5UPV1_9HYPH|nr:DUF2786 domain-containing protein [Breoghania corrubedonensis]PTW53550.1 uncharacterized protein DUF2786 [Breoghania corrubedonensis]
MEQPQSVDIARKVRTLLAKAKSTASEHEAAAFAAKAHELLVKYNLCLSEVSDTEQAGADRTAQDTPSGIYDRWVRIIWTEVTCAYFCEAMVHGRRAAGAPVTIIGAPHNIAVVMEMAPYLVKTVRRLARAYSDSPRYQRQFGMGAAMRLAKRLRELANSRKAADGPAGATTLPALYANEGRLNREFIAENFHVRPARPPRAVYNTPALSAGYALAGDISLNSQIEAA